ncbi:MAG TPA: SDR family oxidoreductase [Kofleriaceae bacterium]|nr:SDR family oxidoreductase [Kofleriaceae bacterium]
MKILITGATGTIGRHLVQELIAGGVRPRMLVRDPAKVAALGDAVEVASGDLDQPATVRAALDGVTAAFLLGNNVEQEGAFIAAAKQAGVRHVVQLSSGGVPYNVAGGVQHAAGERILQDSGLAWTILRPWEFSSNTLQWLGMIGGGAIFDPCGDGATPVIDPRDIAAVAAKVLTTPGHDGKIYTLTGPAAVTRTEMVETLASVIGKPLRYVAIPNSAFREQLAKFMPAAFIGPVADYMQLVADGKLAAVTDDVPRLLGRPARPFAEWARDHAAAFSPAP